ncbi:hypothetical protein EON65_56230 [archaeon]|nr:MAG: hypothetical protein EON65_56230 [archaeon]
MCALSDTPLPPSLYTICVPKRGIPQDRAARQLAAFVDLAVSLPCLRFSITILQYNHHNSIPSGTPSPFPGAGAQSTGGQTDA